MATPVLDLDKFKDSFKTIEGFNAFAKALAKIAEEDMGLVICDEHLVATLFPPEEANKRIQEKIVRRVAENPDLMDMLQKRMESDDLVP